MNNIQNTFKIILPFKCKCVRIRSIVRKPFTPVDHESTIREYGAHQKYLPCVIFDQGFTFDKLMHNLFYHTIRPYLCMPSTYLAVCVSNVPVAITVNTKHLHNIYTKSAQRLRRWSNIVNVIQMFCVYFEAAAWTSVIPCL